MADGAVMEGLKLERHHGKDRVRVGRVWRDPDGTHHFAEWNVFVSLLSGCIPAYVTGDNSAIVATDTMKNTVYVKAKESSERIPVEVFAINLAKHFTTFYEPVSSAIVNIAEKQWERESTDGQPHKHGKKLYICLACRFWVEHGGDCWELKSLQHGGFMTCHQSSLKMPNIHFLPVNLSSKDNLVIVKFEGDVYLPTDEPHGAIEASLSRLQSKL